MKQTRIKWTTDEREQLSRRTAEIMLKNVGMNHLEALKRAQNDGTWPEHRRRKINTLLGISWFKPAVDQIVGELKTPKPDAHTEVRVVKEITTIPLQVQDVPMEALIGEVIRRTLNSNTKWVDMLSAQLVNVFRQQFPVVLRQMRREKRCRPIDPPKDQLKRVLVVGLLGEQENEITKRFDGIFRLSFHKDQNPNSLRALAQHADKVILMSRFISHTAQDLVKQSAVSVTLCHGAVSDLVAILDAYFHEAYK
jgi:hypothetical protein